MNRDYDDELERGRSRRRTGRGESEGGTRRGSSEQERWESWKHQKEQSRGEELDIMGDASVRPLPETGQPRAERQVAWRSESARDGQRGQSRSRGSARQRMADSSRSSAETGGGYQSRIAAGQDGSRQARNGSDSIGGRQTAASREGGRGLRQQAQLERRKKRRRMIVMIVAECITLALIFGYGFFARTMAKLQRDEEFIREEISSNDIGVEFEEQMKGYWTIAVFGVDARDSAISKGTNSDVIMICNINLDTGEIRLVSVYRDSYLNISAEKNTYNKINQAYFLGGPTQAVEALNRNLDLKIWDYVTFNWKAVAQAIDILGGVDIELSKAEFYYINSFITETVKATGIGSHHLTHAGMNHLDGVQAVAYGRLRLMDTDFARTERQRKVVEQAFEKCKQADFDTLYTLIGTVFPNVKTSLWVDDLVNNARNISKFHLGETTGFPKAIGNASLPGKGDCVIPATLEQNVVELHKFLFDVEDYTPSDTVKQISNKIISDTGISKAGQVIDKVRTDAGVIQQPKTTPAETTKAEREDEEDEDEGYQYVYVKDRDGKKVRKKIAMETDEDGEYIPWETDADGFLIEESSSVARPTSPTETDEDGNPVETTRNPLLPSLVETDADGNLIRPTDENGDPISTRPTETAGTGTTGRPGESTGTSERPGETNGAAGRPGETSGGQTVSRPGETAGSGNGTGNHPGETAAIRPTAPTESTGGSRPGASIQAPGTTTPSSEADGCNGPGSGGVTPTAPTAPQTTVQQEPGGVTSIAPTSGGVVAAPGQ